CSRTCIGYQAQATTSTYTLPLLAALPISRNSKRARGASTSASSTSTSRQEQTSASTTPRTFSAGIAGKTGEEIAPWAKQYTSSIRFTTACPVATRFRKVVVSRYGLIVSRSSPQTTPIGAKLTS